VGKVSQVLLVWAVIELVERAAAQLLLELAEQVAAQASHLLSLKPQPLMELVAMAVLLAQEHQ
jgi:hypothetical protein